MKKLMIAFIALPLFAFTSSIKEPLIVNDSAMNDCWSSCGEFLDVIDETLHGGDMPWSTYTQLFSTCVGVCNGSIR